MKITKKNFSITINSSTVIEALYYINGVILLFISSVIMLTHMSKKKVFININYLKDLTHIACDYE